MPTPWDILSGAVLGGPEEREETLEAFDTGGLVGGALHTLSQIPERAGQATGLAALFGPLGDAGDVLGGITGQDPFSGAKLEGWERTAALLGIGTLGVAGLGAGLYLGGKHAYHGFNSARARGWFTGETGAVGPVPAGKFRSKESMWPVTAVDDDLAMQLNQRFPDPDLVWGTLDAYTSEALGVDPHPLVGWKQLTDVAALKELQPEGWSQLNGFLNGIGSRYLDEVPAHVLSVEQYDGDVLKARLAVAAYESTRFEWAATHNKFDGTRLGNARRLWTKLRNGERLTGEQLEELSGAMVEFAQQTQFAVHPEFVMHPLVGLHKVNLDDGSVQLNVVSFDGVPQSRLTETELNRRVRAVMSNHPAALNDMLVENITTFWDEMVTPEAIDRFRVWYPAARTEALTLATENGFDHRKFVAAASILSAGEEWETNLSKTVTVLKLVDRANAGEFRTATGRRSLAILHAAVKKAGVKVSRQDLMKVILLDGLDNIDDAWTAGRRTQGVKLAQLARRWAAGEEPEVLVHERQISAPHQAQKQPSFDYGIFYSGEETQWERSQVLYRLMAGDVGPSRSEMFGEPTRRTLPLVVDRQAYKIALGFSINPDTFLSSNKGVYDAFALAYKQAAARIGEVLGRQLLPEELQAITWMELRRHMNVSGVDWELGHAGNRPPPGITPGWRRMYRGRASAAKGPDFIFSTNVLDLLTGATPAPVRIHGVPEVPVKLRPKQLNQVRPKRTGVDQLQLKMLADGTFHVIGQVESPAHARGKWPSLMLPDGEQAWGDVVPRPVVSVRERFSALAAQAHQRNQPMKPGTITAGLHSGPVPDMWAAPGNHLRLVGPRGSEGSHRRLVAELQLRGVQVELVHEAPRVSLAGGPDGISETASTEAWLKFQSAGDFQAAMDYANNPPDGLFTEILGPADLTPEVLVDPQLTPLKTHRYAVLSAQTTGTDMDRHARLVREVRKAGYDPIEATGVYEGSTEPSLLVFGMSEREAFELGRKYKQDSVLTNSGFVYTGDDAGKLRRPTGEMTFDQTAEDFYTEFTLSDGRTVKWQVPFEDWSDEALVAYTPAGPRWEELYQGQPPEWTAYVDGPQSAPPGAVQVFEHLETDHSGQTLVVLSASGDSASSNTVPVFVSRDTAESARSLALEAGRSDGHRLIDMGEGRLSIDGVITVIDPEGKVKPSSAPFKNLFQIDLRGETKRPTHAVLVTFEGGRQAPMIEYGTAANPVDPGLYDAMPGARVARVTTAKNRNITLHLRGEGGRVDGSVFAEMSDLLRRVGHAFGIEVAIR